MLLALCFSLPVILAGAWYLANPTGVAPLAELEGGRANRARVRLRRANGVLMLLAGVTLYFVISRAIHVRENPGVRAGLALPIAVLALGPAVLAMIALTYLDVRLTRRLKRNIRDAAKRLGQASAVAATLLFTVAIGCDEQATAPETSAVTPAATPPSGNSARQTTLARQDAAPPASRPTPADLPPPQDLPTVEMTIGGEVFTLMVANDEEERRTGLMYRQELLPNEGMLFVFIDDDWLSFFMRNTYIPLDIIYVSGRGRVVDIKQGQPLSERSLPSSGRARYVIELAAGRSRQLGLKKGDVLEMPDVEAEE